MFRYYLKLSLLSIRANPALSALMVAAIAIGIGACMSIVTVRHVMSDNPVAHKNDRLYHVRLYNWNPDAPKSNKNQSKPHPNHQKIIKYQKKHKQNHYENVTVMEIHLTNPAGTRTTVSPKPRALTSWASRITGANHSKATMWCSVKPAVKGSVDR